MEIDWSKAPDWANSHGLCAFNGEIREYWLGDDQYQCLSHSKPFPYGGGVDCTRHNHRPYEFKYVTNRPAPWNGEGLPPVGTRCITTRGAGDREVTILAYGEKMVFVRFGNDELIMELYGREFLPIRTPEQIAAEERKKTITEMLKEIVVPKRTNDAVISAIKDAAAQLYDAGYRKVEGGDL